MMNKILQATLLAVLILPIASACGNSVPEATDEQILTLLGDRLSFGPADRPLTIPKSVEQCPRLLSGLDEVIYKDMPAESLGMFKTSCRTDLAKIINDKSKNPIGFTLEHFENKELATRISRIAAGAEIKAQEFEAAAREAEEAAREKEKADRITARNKKIADAKDKMELLIVSLDQRFLKIDELCAVWDKEFAAAKQANRFLIRIKPDTCQDKFKVRVRKEADDTLAKISSLKAGDGLFDPSIPHSWWANAESLDGKVVDLNAKVDELRALRPLD